MDMITIVQKIEQITTLKELYQLRMELQEIINRKQPKDFFDGLKEVQEAHYFVRRIEARIEDLERKGLFLDKIETTQVSQKEVNS